MRHALMFLLLLPLCHQARSQGIGADYTYSFGYNSISSNEKQIAIYHKLIFTGDSTLEYHRCKIRYINGNFLKPEKLDTIKIKGSWHQTDGKINIDMAGWDGGLEFPISGDYRLTADSLICLNRDNEWFYKRTMFEAGHFKKCAQPGHQRRLILKKVANVRDFKLWICEPEKWTE